MDILHAFGKRIQFIRENRKITQEELANRSGLNAKYISAIECGQRNATIKTIEKLSVALEIDMFELFLFSEHAESKETIKKGIESMLKHAEIQTLYLCLNLLKIAQK